MKKSDIEIGGVYRLKVGKNTTDVRIDAQDYDSGGWVAINLKSGKQTRIKDAKRLLPAKENLKAKAAADQENARLRDERAASPDGMTASERAMTESADDAKQDAKPKRLSCLDAAAMVLAEADEPMNTKAMIKAIFEKKLWSTDAPTPSATLYSAILREMNKKGDAARFRKVDRGHFELAKGA
ncbi:MAG: winged helix-turn-helix domain-containing protein [Phycisphaeraceae bacterium]